MNAGMDWRRLLSRERADGRERPDRHDEPDEDAARSAFERDVSRLLFSNAFRRLHNKTQVFPVPENDHVHSRLTHSLEVADVGRTLGKVVGREVLARHGLTESGLTASDLAEVVAASCLAHDLGNPPFGHAGEDAIGHFFTDGPGRNWVANLSPAERADLQDFEGNAQGFRILARLALYRDQGGMRLTAATLGSFGKYPQGAPAAGDRSRPGGKKFGYFQAEAGLFAAVAGRCGLLPVAGVAGAWHRHPVAYLMEAADDICYHVLDLEDGVMLRLIPAAVMVAAVAPILGQSESALTGKAPAQLRGLAIGVLVKQVAAAFLDHEADILAGRGRAALTELIPAAEQLVHIYHRINMPFCYRSTVALDLEQTGYNVIGGLLRELCDAAFAGRHARLVQILPDGFPDHATPYEKLLLITDYVSGMTDRYALRRFQAWTGIALRGPG